MRRYAEWAPALFCAFLSLMAMAGLISTTAGFGDWWSIPFFSSLPMCFFFAGMVMAQMRREITELRQQVVDLKQQTGHEGAFSSRPI